MKGSILQQCRYWIKNKTKTTKALLRLEKLLPQIIHVDQYADIEGRTMFDAIHTIDIIENIKGQQMCGLMVVFNLILESL